MNIETALKRICLISVLLLVYIGSAVAEEVVIDLDALEDNGRAAKKKHAPKKGEEEVISLDALDGEDENASAGNTTVSVPDEPIYPIEITEIELKKQPVLKAVAIVALLPLVAMLFRVRRRSRRTAGTNSGKEFEG